MIFFGNVPLRMPKPRIRRLVHSGGVVVWACGFFSPGFEFRYAVGATPAQAYRHWSQLVVGKLAGIVE